MKELWMSLNFGLCLLLTRPVNFFTNSISVISFGHPHIHLLRERVIKLVVDKKDEFEWWTMMVIHHTWKYAYTHTHTRIHYMRHDRTLHGAFGQKLWHMRWPVRLVNCLISFCVLCVCVFAKKKRDVNDNRNLMLCQWSVKRTNKETPASPWTLQR